MDDPNNNPEPQREVIYSRVGVVTQRLMATKYTCPNCGTEQRVIFGNAEAFAPFDAGQALDTSCGDCGHPVRLVKTALSTIRNARRRQRPN